MSTEAEAGVGDGERAYADFAVILSLAAGAPIWHCGIRTQGPDTSARFAGIGMVRAGGLCFADGCRILNAAG